MMRFLLRGLAAAGLCLCALPAIAQQAAEKPFRLQTALDLPDWLKVSGSIRPRYETLHNQFTAGRTGDDEMLGVQSLLKAEANTGAVTFGLEMMDVRRIIGNEGGGTLAEVDTFEPLQAYVAWRPKDLLMKGDNLDLNVGRFTMDMGGRRLISRSGFRNILAGFDGIRGVWTGPKKQKVTAFYTAPVNRAPSDAPSALDNEVVFNPTADEVRFSGVASEMMLTQDILGELYLFDLHEDDGDEAPTRNRDLSTFGIRFKRAPKAQALDFEVEYARQTGAVRATAGAADLTDLDHDADLIHAELGYTFKTAWSPRIALQYDFASGDKSPGDLDSQRFDPLFGDRAFEIGPTSLWGLIGRTNLISPGVRLEVKPDARTEIAAAVRQVKLDSATDSFGNAGVRDPSGLSGDNVGTHFELRYRRALIPDSVRLTVGAAALSRGRFLKEAPNATGTGDPLFGYTELLFTF